MHKFAEIKIRHCPCCRIWIGLTLSHVEENVTAIHQLIKQAASEFARCRVVRYKTLRQKLYLSSQEDPSFAICDPYNALLASTMMTLGWDPPGFILREKCTILEKYRRV